METTHWLFSFHQGQAQRYSLLGDHDDDDDHDFDFFKTLEFSLTDISDGNDLMTTNQCDCEQWT